MKAVIVIVIVTAASLGLAMWTKPPVASVGAKPRAVDWAEYIEAAPTLAQKVARARERDRLEVEPE